MSNEINAIGDSLAQVSEIAAKARKPQGGEPARENAAVEATARGDAVSFTETAAKLRELEGSLASVPVVDTQRVETVRKAVADGAYKIEPGRVAEKMVEFEGLLNEVGPSKS